MDFTPILKSLSTFFPSSSITRKKSTPFVVMILSPHPDDECIVSSLPLRLARENGAKIINVAVTLGSKKSRQAERWQELQAAAKVLDMLLLELPEEWKNKRKALSSIIEEYGPHLIVSPHLKDRHPTHIRTGKLLKEALRPLKKLNCLIAWSEFWFPQTLPQVLLEVPLEILELQMRALEKHQGEIERNPYHLRLPAWMMDNVRRGSEILQGMGGHSPQYAFGVLYGLEHFIKGKFYSVKLKSPFLDTQKDLAQTFKLILAEASGSKTKVK